MSGVTPMPYTVEALATGTALVCNMHLQPQTTSVERSCLMHAIKLIEFLGGKQASGFGVVTISASETLNDAEYVDWCEADNIITGLTCVGRMVV